MERCGHYWSALVCSVRLGKVGKGERVRVSRFGVSAAFGGVTGSGAAKEGWQRVGSCSAGSQNDPRIC